MSDKGWAVGLWGWRRLQQNRLAAKRSYNKRVQRQAQMETEYDKLRNELDATNQQITTLGDYQCPVCSEALQTVDLQLADADGEISLDAPARW